MLMFAAGLAGDGSAQSYSELWGEAGEKWSPRSRLPDFSRAGYRNGERLIPDVPVVTNVMDFGAVGDGQAVSRRGDTFIDCANDSGKNKNAKNNRIVGRCIGSRPLQSARFSIAERKCSRRKAMGIGFFSSAKPADLTRCQSPRSSV